MARFYFSKHEKFDLALLTEVQAINPYSVKPRQSSKLWAEIAENLKQSELKMEVTGRSCRERTNSLLKDFKADEGRSSRASGISESEMTELEKLLTSVSEQEKQPVVLELTKAHSSKANRAKAEETRNRALQEIDVDKEADDLENISAESESEVELVPTQKKLKLSEDKEVKSEKKTNPTKNKNDELIIYLKEKSKNEFDVKKEEIKVRAIEAENRKFELGLQSERQQAELAERSRMTDLMCKLLEQKTKE